MALGRGQVDQPALARARRCAGRSSAGIRPRAAERRSTTLRGLLLQRRQLEFHVEVAAVADDRAVLHGREMLAADDAGVAGDGDEDVADRGRLGHRHDGETVHRRFQGPDRIDLGDDHLAPRPRARRATPLPHQP